ncbi:MAG TPA: metallophosphoesterase [Gemmataceae bacterium]|nr:metallophosphoesterase [Gemmataceae bacterium]
MPSPVLIIVVSILAADLFWWRRADRRARRLRHAFGWRLLIGLFMGGQVALFLWILGGRVAAASSLGRPPQLLSAVAYLWHLLLLPAGWALVAITGILFWAWRWGWRVAGWTALCRRDANTAARPAPLLSPTSVPADRTGETATRRQFIGMLTTVTPALLTGAAAAYSRTQVRDFRIRPIAVALPSLPPELDGLRIALVSDLHVGTFTNGQTIKDVVDETSRLDADLVLLPGDLINSDLSDLSDALDAVCNMQSRHGSYLCVGNHDLIEDGAAFVRRVRARLPLLVNESRIVPIRGQLVQLLGLPWNRDEVQIANSVRELSGQIAPGAFPILLAHHPHAFDAAASVGIPLTISGHTHGGQLMLSDAVGFGPLMYRYWSGLYRKPRHNGASLVVSNGVGNWFPLRIGAPAEIIHLTLRSIVQSTGRHASSR